MSSTPSYFSAESASPSQSVSVPDPTASSSETSQQSLVPGPIGTPRPGDSAIALATARAYEDDLLKGKYQDAWNMLTPEFRVRIFLVFMLTVASTGTPETAERPRIGLLVGRCGR